jgi:NhaP-type Na+/H+ or K+/H+ antiporter
MWTYRNQLAAVVLTSLSLVFYVLLPQPYALWVFWVVLGVGILTWFYSLWVRYQGDTKQAEEAKTELLVTLGFVGGAYLIGWVSGWMLAGYDKAWVIGFVAGIGGFVIALAPLRSPPDPPPPDN